MRRFIRAYVDYVKLATEALGLALVVAAAVLSGALVMFLVTAAL